MNDFHQEVPIMSASVKDSKSFNQPDSLFTLGLISAQNSCTALNKIAKQSSRSLEVSLVNFSASKQVLC